MAPVSRPVEKVKYQYYQSAEKLTVTLLVKNLSPERVSVTYPSGQRLVVSVSDQAGAGAENVLDIWLFDDVIPEQCTVTVKPSKVDIMLKKKHPSNWDTLEGSSARRPTADAVVTSTEPIAEKKPSATETKPKAYASSKDWDKIGGDIQRELDEEKPEGEEALQKLFRDIYAKATPETRRAMNKSFQTSGGTVLSTNWDEVSKADYERDRKAPKGVEWKDWEGRKLPSSDD